MMQALQNILDAITNIFRVGLLMWFGAIMLFGFVVTGLSYSGGLWGESSEERAERQEQRVAAQNAAAQRKLDYETERDMRKDGWGNSAPVRERSETERRRDEAFDELIETQARRDAGWGS